MKKLLILFGVTLLFPLLANADNTLTLGNGAPNQNLASGDVGNALEVVLDSNALMWRRCTLYGNGTTTGACDQHDIRMRGTPASPSGVLDGDVLGARGFRGHDGVGPTGSQAAEKVYVTGNWSGSNHGAKFVWGATPSGSVIRNDSMTFDGNTLTVPNISVGGCSGCGVTSLWNTGSGSAIYYNGAPVGIGTTTPSYSLEVHGNSQALISGASNSTALYELFDSPLSTGNNNYFLFGVDTTGGTVGYATGGDFLATGSNGTGVKRNMIFITFDTGEDIIFAPHHTEKVRITNSGLVGIGTSAPAGALDVWGGIYSNGTAGVSCPAGSVNPSTMVITNGLVTHC